MAYDAVKCFWLEETDKVQVSLRRFCFSSDKECPARQYGHDSRSVVIGEASAIKTDRNSTAAQPPTAKDDPRWPTHCEACGYEFEDEDQWQTNGPLIYRVASLVEGAQVKLGQAMTLRDAPPGAMWDAAWMGEHYRGPDGMHLLVKCPNGGDWTVDGRASNCGSPDDNEHHCWVRHGKPPFITVDKDGNTCTAGAGSIQIGDYHGFLRGGELTAG